jgi:hypothetical protein
VKPLPSVPKSVHRRSNPSECSSTCKSRFCTSCGQRATEAWQADLEAVLPDIPYVGITVTLPMEFRTILQQTECESEYGGVWARSSAGATLTRRTASHNSCFNTSSWQGKDDEITFSRELAQFGSEYKACFESVLKQHRKITRAVAWLLVLESIRTAPVARKIRTKLG